MIIVCMPYQHNSCSNNVDSKCLDTSIKDILNFVHLFCTIEMCFLHYLFTCKYYKTKIINLFGLQRKENHTSIVDKKTTNRKRCDHRKTQNIIAF